MHLSNLSLMQYVVFNMFISFSDLSWQMSMWRCSDELRHRADVLHRSSKRDAKHYIGNCYRDSPMSFYFFGYKGFENVF